MSIRQSLAVSAARLTRLAARILRRGGTSLPGEIALRIDPHLPRELLRDQEVILVSGTNGKTSTVHFLATLCRGLGYEVIANWSGANLIYGITATLLAAPRAQAQRAKKRVYIFEIDEAHLAKHAVDLHPHHIILTNLHADQSDRYGSVRELQRKLREGLRPLGPEVHLYLPAGDPELALIARDHGGATHFFGRELSPAEEATWQQLCETSPEMRQAQPESPQDCPECGHPLAYAWREYGQHGGFACTHCDFVRRTPELTYRLQSTATGDEALLTLRLESAPGDTSSARETALDNPSVLRLDVPGEHNLINACAALLPLLVEGHSLSELLPLLREAKAPFGRMERFHLQTHEGLMILVKNPVGLETGLRAAAKQPHIASLVLIINKRVNDGTDDSWLRDAHLPELLGPLSHLPLIVAGESSALLHEILRDAEIPHVVASDEKSALREALELSPPGSTILFLPNYSAMIDFRNLLATDYDVPDFWAEG